MSSRSTMYSWPTTRLATSRLTSCTSRESAVACVDCDCGCVFVATDTPRVECLSNESRFPFKSRTARHPLGFHVPRPKPLCQWGEWMQRTRADSPDTIVVLLKFHPQYPN